MFSTCYFWFGKKVTQTLNYRPNEMLHINVTDSYTNAHDNMEVTPDLSQDQTRDAQRPFPA